MDVARLERIEKYYRVNGLETPALRGVDISIRQHDFMALAGPSGSGKTTMLNIIGCLDKPTNGEVYIGDARVSDLTRNELADFRLIHMGFIFQTFNLIPVLTAFENVEFPLLLEKKYSKEERQKKVETLLSEVGLRDFMHRRPNQLSGGQQQRVAVARALVKNPDMVLADEPTANLDSKTGEDLLQLMQEMNEKHITTFIFSTHDPMVMEFASRLVKLHDGEIISDEPRP